MSLVDLGEITETVMGQAPPGKECNKDGVGTIFVKAGEFGPRFPIEKEWTTKPLKFSKSGDVLVCVVGATAGKINLGIDCAIGRSVAAIRPLSEHLDTDYLHYFMRQQTAKMRQKSQGLAQGVITKTMLASMKIPLPPLPEQKRIAAILDQADALRRQRQAALDRLNALGQSIFYDMFGYIKAEEDFGDLVYYQEGPGVRKWQFRESGVKLINVKNIVNGNLVTSNTWRHLEAEEVDKKYTHFLLNEGDLVVASSGVTWGKIAEVEKYHLPLCLNTSMIRLRAKSSTLSQEYIRSFVELGSFRRQINKLITGSAQPNFGPSHLKQVKIPVPEKETQLAYVEKIASLKHSQKNNAKSLANLNSLFSSLQQRAFRGEL